MAAARAGASSCLCCFLGMKKLLSQHVWGARLESSTAGGSWTMGLSTYPPGQGSEGFHGCEVFGYPDPCSCLWQSSPGPWGVVVKDTVVSVACSAFNTALCVFLR